MSCVSGMGNPLMDTILSGTAEDLKALNAVPGSMNLVEFDTQQEVIRRCRQRSKIPGGSCANTIRAIAWLSRQRNEPPVRTVYLGAVGVDPAGDAFDELLRTEGVDPKLARKTTPTGSSAIVVTPDSERTMFTYLGACRDLGVQDLDPQLFAGSKVFHTTGYMWDTPNQEEAVGGAVSLARGRGAMISLDIADPFVADRYRDRLLSWMPGKVDLLFANRQELYSLTGQTDDDAALVAAGELADRVVMKVGAQGCVVHGSGRTTAVAGVVVDARDTTGAGDAFAGGYLYGVVRGWDALRCAWLANRIAAQMCTVEGCRYDAIDPADLLTEGRVFNRK